jgi:hypothetical protein
VQENCLKRRLFCASTVETSADSLDIPWTADQLTHDLHWASVNFFLFHLQVRWTAYVMNILKKDKLARKRII